MRRDKPRKKKQLKEGTETIPPNKINHKRPLAGLDGSAQRHPCKCRGGGLTKSAGQRLVLGGRLSSGADRNELTWGGGRREGVWRGARCKLVCQCHNKIGLVRWCVGKEGVLAFLTSAQTRGDGKEELGSGGKKGGRSNNFGVRNRTKWRILVH